MTVFDALMKLTGGMAGLLELLERAKVALPDAAPIAEEWIQKLNSSLSAEGLTALAVSLPSEFMDIVKGDFNPHDHPSDSL